MGSLADGHDWAKTRDWRAPRSGCAETFFGLWEVHQPKVWVMESVTQLTTRGREFVNSVVNRARGMGYGTWIIYHDPKFMGLPQSRRRVFLVVSSVDIITTPPGGPHLTVGDVLGNGIEPSAIHQLVDGDLYWWGRAKPGEDFNPAWVRAGSPPETKPKHRTGHRIDPATPLGAVHSDGHFAHPTEPRYLSARELAHLTGYPVDYQWPASDPTARAQVAKGVTPTAGDWLGGCLVRSLGVGKPARHDVVTVVNYMSIGPTRGDFRMVNTVREIPVDEYLSGGA